MEAGEHERVYNSIQPILSAVNIDRALFGAAEDLADQRAKLLYDLWIGLVNAADALLWARMGATLEDVRNLPQMQR